MKSINTSTTFGAIAIGSFIFAGLSIIKVASATEVIELSNARAHSSARSVVVAQSHENSFSDNNLYAADAASGDGKCGEGKCGDGKAGDSKSPKKAAPSGGSKGADGKCGEGKCGDAGTDKAPKHKKPADGKCGEGKCGDSD